MFPSIEAKERSHLDKDKADDAQELVITSIPSFPHLHLSAHLTHLTAVDETGLYLTSKSSLKKQIIIYSHLE